MLFDKLFKKEEDLKPAETKMYEAFVSTIRSWTCEDIYVISMYVSDDCDNPFHPLVTLGYNTESQLRDEYTVKHASGDAEARWNFAFWLQNKEFVFGEDDGVDMMKEWLNENGFKYMTHKEFYGHWDLDDDSYNMVPVMLVDSLVKIVKKIHSSGIIRETFGKELPIIIHELEYAERIAQQNIEANGKILPEEFVRFCKGN